MANPAIPFSPHAPESYEGRFNATVRRQVGNLSSYTEQVRLGRLAAYNSATAAPTGGTWAAGDIVRNSLPIEAGGAGSMYVLIGWICVASGTPGTWLPMRTLTGN